MNIQINIKTYTSDEYVSMSVYVHVLYVPYSQVLAYNIIMVSSGYFLCDSRIANCVCGAAQLFSIYLFQQLVHPSLQCLVNVADCDCINS